jgi:hypothetical protein
MLQHEIKADTFSSVRNARDVMCRGEEQKRVLYMAEKINDTYRVD